MDMLALIFVAVLANNVILSQFLGICPYLGLTRRLETAVGMGLAVTFVMVLAALVTWVAFNIFLVPFNIVFLRIIAFILMIAGMVQLLEMILKKLNPTLFRAFGIYLPLITVNCAIMGVAIMNAEAGRGIVEALVFAISTGTGFLLAMIIMAGIRERLELVTMSSYLQGAAVTLVTCGILSLAFMGFKGLVTL